MCRRTPLGTLLCGLSAGLLALAVGTGSASAGGACDAPLAARGAAERDAWRALCERPLPEVDAAVDRVREAAKAVAACRRHAPPTAYEPMPAPWERVRGDANARRDYCRFQEIKRAMEHGEVLGRRARLDLRDAEARFRRGITADDKQISEAIHALSQSLIVYEASGRNARRGYVRRHVEALLRAGDGLTPEVRDGARTYLELLGDNPLTTSDAAYFALAAKAIVAGLPATRLEAARREAPTAGADIDGLARDLDAMKQATDPRLGPLAARYEVLVDDARLARLRASPELSPAERAWAKVAREMREHRPLPRGALKAFRSAAAPLAERHPSVALRLAAIEWEVAFYRAFWRKRPAAALARALGARSVASHARGRRGPKTLRLVEGRCYLMVGGRPGAWVTVPLAVAAREWAPPVDGQLFNVHVGGVRHPGVCVGRSAKVPAPTKVAAPWVVVSWPRDRLPEQVRYRIGLRLDPCQGEASRALWQDPVPGTVALVDGVGALHLGGGVWVDAVRRPLRPPLAFVTGEPLVPTPSGSLRYARCVRDDPRYIACKEAKGDRWREATGPAEAAVKTAKTRAERATARAALKATQERFRREHEHDCDDEVQWWATLLADAARLARDATSGPSALRRADWARASALFATRM